jgi:beta-lactamase superfamily II metal-dependent hydrolase
VAVISLGNGNTHDHPTLKALKRLAAADVDRIFQTNWGTTKDGLLSNMTIPLEVQQFTVDE